MDRLKMGVFAFSGILGFTNVVSAADELPREATLPLALATKAAGPQ